MNFSHLATYTAGHWSLPYSNNTLLTLKLPAGIIFDLLSERRTMTYVGLWS